MKKVNEGRVNVEGKANYDRVTEAGCMCSSGSVNAKINASSDPCQCSCGSGAVNNAGNYNVAYRN